jgi:thiosulfate reductase/polysulfide reductase chain A
MSIDTVTSVCGMCPVQCPIEVEVENGSCRFIHGNRLAPGIRGALCTKGAAGISFLNDNDRPSFPMLRSGVRGQGGWRRIDWDEAFSVAAERLKACAGPSGSQQLMWLDSGGCFSELRMAFARSITPFALTESSFFTANADQAARSLFGINAAHLVPDFCNARQIVLQGRNLFETVHIQQANDLLDALERGAELSVIDFRSNTTTSKASRWLAVRPGTDYALNLAIIHLLLKNHRGILSEAQLEGLDELETAVQDCTASWAQNRTGIPENDIVMLAKSLAKAAPKVIWMTGKGVWGYADSFYICRSAWIINALLGAIGTPGGFLIAQPVDRYGEKPLGAFPSGSEAASASGSAAAHATLDLNVMGPFDRIGQSDETPISSLICYRTDPLAVFPDPTHTRELLQKLETIICITDSWSETAWMADLVLPLSAFLERESIIGRMDSPLPCWVLRKRCIEPKNDTKADWEIVAGLAKKLNRPDLAFDSAQALWQHQLEGSGIRIRDFDRTGFIRIAEYPSPQAAARSAFPPAGEKIAVFSPVLKSIGVAPLAPFAPKPAPNEGRFRLIAGGCAFHDEGRTINVPLLNRQMPENVLWMNRSAAAQMGIANGDSVIVSNGETQGIIPVRLSEFIAPEAVFLVNGFGRSVPAESRAYGKGLSAVRLMTEGWKLRSNGAGSLCWSEHFVQVSRLGNAKQEESRS